VGVEGAGREVIYAASGGHFFLHPEGNDGENPTGVSKIQQIGAGELVVGQGGAVLMLAQASGRTTVNGPVALDAIEQQGGDLTVQQHATSKLDVVNIGGGTAKLERSLDGVLRITGGAVEVGRIDTDATSPPDYSGAEVHVHGGMLRFRGRGTIAKVRVDGDGAIDLSEVPVAMTITMLAITEAAARRSNLESRYVTITKTTTEFKVGHSGQFGE
jgi:hypothetical protein